MSQHSFNTTHNGHSVSVTMGWDRMIGYFFLTVEDHDADEELNEPEYLYSNLDQPEPFGLTLDDYRAALTELGLVVPETMFVETLKDAENNIGNRYEAHDLPNPP